MMRITVNILYVVFCCYCHISYYGNQFTFDISLVSATQWRSESGFLMNMSDALSVCWSALCPPPNTTSCAEQTHCTSLFPPRNPACLLLKSPLLCVLFLFRCLHCSSAGGSSRAIPGVKGECIIGACCQICCGQVFIIIKLTSRSS